MENLKYFIDLFLHLDTHLSAITNEYGLLTYLLLFVIVFCETGLVVTPFYLGIPSSSQLELWPQAVRSIYQLY